MNCFHFFRTENELESHKEVWKNKDFCGLVIPSEDTKILDFNQHLLSHKMLYVIYADLKSLVKRIDVYKNNPGKSSTAKIGGHVPWNYSMSTIWIFDGIKSKYNVYRREDCMKTFCESLQEHTMKINDFEKSVNN